MSGKFEIQNLEKFNSLKQSQCDLKSTKSCHNLFSIPKAKSGSIPIKIRQPFIWTDPYLSDLMKIKEI